MKDYLKTKCMSLTAEAKIIRRLERNRLKKARQAYAVGKTVAAAYHAGIFHGLRCHRIWDVREEARHSNLAYGFLRGRSYNIIEKNAHKQPNWKRIQTLIEKYGEGNKDDLIKNYNDWKNKAIVGFEKRA